MLFLSLGIYYYSEKYKITLKSRKKIIDKCLSQQLIELYSSMKYSTWIYCPRDNRFLPKITTFFISLIIRVLSLIIMSDFFIAIEIKVLKYFNAMQYFWVLFKWHRQGQNSEKLTLMAIKFGKTYCIRGLLVWLV